MRDELKYRTYGRTDFSSSSASLICAGSMLL